MSSNEEALQRKIERQKRQIELLEQLIEDRSRDIFRAEQDLLTTERQLVDASRRAGMAAVATSVLVRSYAAGRDGSVSETPGRRYTSIP